MKEILKPAYACHMATGDHLKDLGRIQQSLPGRYLQKNSLDIEFWKEFITSRNFWTL